jgi:hypothetical protein
MQQMLLRVACALEKSRGSRKRDVVSIEVRIQGLVLREVSMTQYEVE